MIPIKNPIPGIMVLWMLFNKILNFVIEQRGRDLEELKNAHSRFLKLNLV